MDKSKALADLVSSESLLPGSETAISSVSFQGKKGEGAFWKSADPIHQGSTLMT